MIPKTIHYCWFGRNPLPELAVKCIESWKKYCPDYEIIEWNEDNFDVESNLYVKQAYEHRKFAFVSDYVRLYALYQCGGIYMDTDVEVLKPLDEYLDCEGFTGFENKQNMVTGIMASVKGLPLIQDLLAYYDDRSFIDANGNMDTTTNTVIITSMLGERGFVANNQKQSKDGFVLYPQNVFCPEHKKVAHKRYMKETATIHWFAGSWKSAKTKKRETSLWFQVLKWPWMLFSKIMSAIFGEKWKKAKYKLRNKYFKDE